MPQEHKVLELIIHRFTCYKTVCTYLAHFKQVLIVYVIDIVIYEHS